MTAVKEIAALVLSGALGACMGYLQFKGLRLNVDSYLDVGVRPRAVGLHTLRLVLIAGGFVALARFGAAPLLTGFAGLLLMRMILLAQYRSQS